MNLAKLLIIISTVLMLSCEKYDPSTVKRKKNISLRYINNPSDTELVLYTTGMLDKQYQEASLIIARKYGFTYWPAAGCIVSDSIINFVFKNNRIVNKVLTQINGIDWQRRFNQEVDIMQNRISMAKKLYYNSPIYPFLKLFDDEYHAGIDFTPDSSDTNYVNARLYWSDRWKNYYREETFDTYSINIHKRTFILSDSIGKIEFIINNRR